MAARVFIMPNGARILTLPGGERNHVLLTERHRQICERADVQEQFATVQRLLTSHHVNRLLTNTHDVAGHARQRQAR